MAKKSTKRNPQDSTLRNVRAALARHRALAARVCVLESALTKVTLERSGVFDEFFVAFTKEMNRLRREHFAKLASTLREK